MLKHVSNFFLQIFPSVVATVVGAYIVTNYINTKPAADAPKAAVASNPETAKDVTKEAGPAAAAKADVPAEETDKPKQAEKPALETRRQAWREKPSEKPEKSVKAAPVPAVTAAPVQTMAAAPAAPVADPAPASENRDANDLARAALDRLRGPVEAAKQPEARQPEIKQPEAPRQPEVAKQLEPQRQAPPASRAAEQPRIATAMPVQPHVQQSVQPLPPAMLVTAPSNGPGPRNDEAQKPREPAKEERSVSFRPPAEIPAAPPLDLRAAGRADTSIADDVVATARSVFNAVIPR